MSIVYKDPHGVAHWVSHQRDDVNQVGGWTERRFTAYCGVMKTAMLTGAWINLPGEGAPTCFECLRRQRQFVLARQTMRDAGAVMEKLDELQWGKDGKNVDDLIELHQMGAISTRTLVKNVFDI